MRFQTLLLASAASVCAALDYPATVEISLVFPKNETYNNITNFPFALAVQNAAAAFDWGWSLHWRMEGPITALGSVRENGDRKPPPESVDNMWVVADTASNASFLIPGAYRLEWEWSTFSCIESGNTIIFQNGVSASGVMDFSIVSDGSGAPVSFTDCPVYQDRITAGLSTDTGCPTMTSDESEEKKPEDGCGMRLDDTVAACMVGGDEDACAELRDRGDEDSVGARDIGLRLPVVVGATLAIGLHVLW